jgi:curved DNA-binding protein
MPDDLRDGMVLRLPGLGEPGEKGAENGDVFLTVRIRSDSNRRLVGEDIEADVSIAPWESLDGTSVGVRTPLGTATVTIPPSTKAGERLRLRGQGLTRKDGSRADFYIVVRLALPDDLTEQQRALLRQAGMTEQAQSGQKKTGDGP